MQVFFFSQIYYRYRNKICHTMNAKNWPKNACDGILEGSRNKSTNQYILKQYDRFKMHIRKI